MSKANASALRAWKAYKALEARSKANLEVRAVRGKSAAVRKAKAQEALGLIVGAFFE